MSIPPSNTINAWKGSAALENLKVLLVEDDPVTRWIVRSALKDECCLATADCANKAFAICQSYQPDIVFLDMNLPDKNGVEVLEWIMRNDPGVCVVIFSGCGNIQDISGALGGGARGYIAKPFVKKNFLYYIKGPAEPS